jgi:tRNA A-37 threonylcarbamoyl transferase component Bud32
MTCENAKCKIYNKGVPIQCSSVKLFGESLCYGPWYIRKRTGEHSSNGSVYMITNTDGVINILKQVIYDYENTADKVLREVNMHSVAVDVGIAPPILEVMYNDTGCSIIMAPLSVTLDRVVLNSIGDLDGHLHRISQLVDTATLLIRKLHNAGITHNDAHSNNFMLNDKGRMFLIDYGKAQQGTNLEKYYMDCNRLVNSILKRFDVDSGIYISLQSALKKYTKPPTPKITNIVW